MTYNLLQFENKTIVMQLWAKTDQTKVSFFCSHKNFIFQEKGWASCQDLLLGKEFSEKKISIKNTFVLFYLLRTFTCSLN